MCWLAFSKMILFVPLLDFLIKPVDILFPVQLKNTYDIFLYLLFLLNLKFFIVIIRFSDLSCKAMFMDHKANNNNFQSLGFNQKFIATAVVTHENLVASVGENRSLPKIKEI